MIKYLNILILIFALIGSQALCQDKKASEYQSISKRKIRLDRQVPELLMEAEQLIKTDIKSALDKVEEALAISITQNDALLQAQCYNILGRINTEIHEWELAINDFQYAFDLLVKEYTQTEEYYQSVDGLAQSYASIGNYEKALFFHESKFDLKISPQHIAETYINVADVYFLFNKNEDALRSIDKADGIVKANNLTQLKSLTQTTKAKILAKKGEIGAAETLFQQGQSDDFDFDDFEIRQKNEESIESSKEELINAYAKEDRFADEIELRNQAITSNTLRQLPDRIVKEKQALSKALANVGNRNAAIRELEEAAVLADSIKNYYELANAYKALAQTWDEAGNTSQSLLYYRKYSLAIDNLQNEQKNKQETRTEILKKQQDILSLTQELKLDESNYNLERTSSALEFNKEKLQQFIIYSLIILLIIVITASIFIYRNAIKSKTISQLLALKSLRSQMNPHFIFNALNSVNQFIALNDERAANKFLSQFSKLMRLVLDNSQNDFITLAEEKEIIELYLKLEHYRFRDKFDFNLSFDENLSLDAIEIPPMLIQPYIENAIWHGLRYKEDPGNLNVKFIDNHSSLKVEVTDDGIGRVKSRILKTENQKSHSSTGLKNTEQRIKIINRVYHKNYSVVVEDLNTDQTGTCVTITLPQNGKKH